MAIIERSERGGHHALGKEEYIRPIPPDKSAVTRQAIHHIVKLKPEIDLLLVIMSFRLNLTFYVHFYKI